MENNTIDAFGYVLKEERFEKLSSKIIPGTLVVEDLHPYPGYHGQELPENTDKPGHIYYITKKTYSWEEITAISNKIKKYIDFSFQHYDSVITGGTKKYHAVRVRGLSSYEHVEKLQRAYQAEGIEFEKDKKFPEIGLTKLKKFFILEKLNENIFADKESANHFYLIVNETISWEFFRQVTILSRSNLPNINFDAAQAVIYYRNEMYDTIRIFGEKIDLKQLTDLREKYVELIEKYS